MFSPKLWEPLSLLSFLVLCICADILDPIAEQRDLGTNSPTWAPYVIDGGHNLAASWTTLPGQSNNDYSNPAEAFLASSENSAVDCGGSNMKPRRQLSKVRRDANDLCILEQPKSDLSSPAGQQQAPASQLDTTGTSASGSKKPGTSRDGGRSKKPVQHQNTVPLKPLMGEPNMEICHEFYTIPVCHRPFFGSIREATPEVWSLIPCRGCEFPSPLSASPEPPYTFL
ncbi:hypothetical protein MMC31_003142 [Peltigera leucophlebia]|nr:hypothetical protein [Peltigera leucophlebia]